MSRRWHPRPSCAPHRARHSDGEAGSGSRRRVSRRVGRDALMPPRLEDGLRDGRAVGRVPGDRGRSGARTPARAHPASGLRLAARPRNVGAAARRVRTLPAVTLSDTGGQGERTRSRRSGRIPLDYDHHAGQPDVGILHATSHGVSEEGSLVLFFDRPGLAEGPSTVSPSGVLIRRRWAASRRAGSPPRGAGRRACQYG